MSGKRGFEREWGEIVSDLMVREIKNKNKIKFKWCYIIDGPQYREPEAYKKWSVPGR